MCVAGDHVMSPGHRKHIALREGAQYAMSKLVTDLLHGIIRLKVKPQAQSKVGNKQLSSAVTAHRAKRLSRETAIGWSCQQPYFLKASHHLS